MAEFDPLALDHGPGGGSDPEQHILIDLLDDEDEDEPEREVTVSELHRYRQLPEDNDDGGCIIISDGGGGEQCGQRQHADSRGSNSAAPTFTAIDAKDLQNRVEQLEEQVTFCVQILQNQSKFQTQQTGNYKLIEERMKLMMEGFNERFAELTNRIDQIGFCQSCGAETQSSSSSGTPPPPLTTTCLSAITVTTEGQLPHPTTTGHAIPPSNPQPEPEPPHTTLVQLRFQCGLCGKSFNYRENLMNHLRSVHGQRVNERVIPCPTEDCGSTTVTVTAAQDMLLPPKGKGVTENSQQPHNHDSAPTQNRAAGPTRQDVRSLQLQLERLVSGGQKRRGRGTCSICGKYVANLCEHLEIHNSAGHKYFCEKCGAGFTTKLYVTRHKKKRTQLCTQIEKQRNIEANGGARSVADHNDDSLTDNSFQGKPTTVPVTNPSRTNEPDFEEETEPDVVSNLSLVWGLKQEQEEQPVVEIAGSNSEHFPRVSTFPKIEIIESSLTNDNPGPGPSTSMHRSSNSNDGGGDDDDIDRAIQGQQWFQAKKPCGLGGTCSVCGKYDRYLGQHMKMQHSTNPPKYFCGTCGLGFVTKKMVRAHQKSHNRHRPPYSCETCGKSFRVISSLQTHSCARYLRRYGRQAKTSSLNTVQSVRDPVTKASGPESEPEQESEPEKPTKVAESSNLDSDQFSRIQTFQKIEIIESSLTNENNIASPDVGLSTSMDRSSDGDNDDNDDDEEWMNMN